MEELKSQIRFLCILMVLLSLIIVAYKGRTVLKFINTPSASCTKITDSICLSEDFGLRTNYYEASTICSKNGMRLPTLDDAWEIWTTSENCIRAFAANEELYKDKKAFTQNCNDSGCTAPAQTIKNYCAELSFIKFPMSSQYNHGSFWLKNSASEDKHYTINYFSGKISPQKNNTKSFGVRCIK